MATLTLAPAPSCSPTHDRHRRHGLAAGGLGAGAADGAGLALFYGGMVRSKSVLNMMMMTFGALAAITVIWVVVGYSLAFGDDLGAGLVGNPLAAPRAPGRCSGRTPTPG